jgi:outer membrane protein
MKKIICLLFLLWPASASHAQQEMNLEDAIRLGLKNNYDIRIARTAAEIARINAGLGTAGFLPTLDATGSYRLNDTEEKSSASAGTSRYETDNWTGDISLNWTVFDGFKMFVEKGRYNALARLGEFQARNAIENTVVAISRAYLNLVQQEQLLDVAQQSRDISETRLNKERIRNDVGGASSTDLLNAQVSFNNDQSSLLNQQLQVSIAREELNVLLGRDPATPLVVSREISIPAMAMEFDQLLNAAIERNSGLKIARQNKIVADRGLQAARAAFFPRLSLNAGYGYTDLNRSYDSPPAMTDLTAQTSDIRVGLVLTFNLFNGGRDKIQWQNARRESEIRELSLRDAHNQLAGTVRQKYETFIQRMELVGLEEQNIVAARQNLELQQDRFALGVAGSLEFRDAQVNLIRAQTALIVARYQARITRLEIEQLIGNLRIE